MLRARRLVLRLPLFLLAVFDFFVRLRATDLRFFRAITKPPQFRDRQHK
jgi:hypothetical protein